MNFLCIIKNNSQITFNQNKPYKKANHNYIELINIKNNYFDIYFFYNQSPHIRVNSGKTFIVLGRLFSIHSGEERFNIEPEVNYTDIVKKYWGQYTIIYLEGSQLNIYKNQSCNLDIFYKNVNEGEFILSSEIVEVYKYLNTSLSFNCLYLRNFVAFDYLFGNNTAFEGIKELRNGYQVNISDKNIIDVLNFRVDVSMDYCSIDYPALLCNVIKSWVKPYNQIILEFSSGLDSTALLYSLLNVVSQEQLTVVNHYVKNIGGSIEVEFAQKVCKELGVGLDCIDFSERSLFDPPKNLSTRLFNKPLVNFPAWNQDTWLKDEIYMDKLPINGYGGDWIFMKPPSIYAIVDAYIDEGIYEAYLSLNNYCDLQRKSIFYVGSKNIATYLNYKIFHKYPQVNSYKYPKWILDCGIQLNDGLTDIIKLSKDKKLLVGKYCHLVHLFNAFKSSIFVGNKSDIGFYFPYLSEPITNYAMSIPTYKLFSDRFDRVLPRNFISQKYNTDNVWRTIKGDTTGFWLQSFKKNRAYITDTCCNGYMADNGFVKKDILVKRIKEFASGYLSDNDFMAITRLYCVEHFIQGWKCNYV